MLKSKLKTFKTTDRKSSLERDIAHAVSNNELHLVYQPIIHGEKMEVRGLEALLRWEHERYGVIAPCEFIPYAEQSGIISEVGQWVIGEALQGFKRMQEEIPELRYVSVNVSPSQLKDDGLVDCIKKYLSRQEWLAKI